MKIGALTEAERAALMSEPPTRADAEFVRAVDRWIMDQWPVQSLPVVVTEATYRGLDYREPTWDDVAEALSRVLPQETPFLVHLAKRAVKRGRR